MRIFVTAKDIREGAKSACEACPVARAIKRRVTCRVVVGMGFISFGLKSSVLTPTQVANFIDRFDGGKKVKPFSFLLDVPKQYVR